MALIRWQRPELTRSGFEELDQLRREMDRLLELSPFGEFSQSQLFNEWAPAIDLYEDKDQYLVKAELPGMKKEDIDVSLHNGALTISGERKFEEKHEEGANYRTERFFGRFQRTVTLPKIVAGDKVKANYKDGILTVTLQKSEDAKPKQIEVQVK
jgi:HSP20 family protein